MRKISFLIVIAMLLMVINLTAYTQGAWSMTQISVGGQTFNVFTCDITQTTNDSVCWTAKTMPALNTTEPFTAIFNSAGATLDAAAVVVNVIYGWASTAAVTGTHATPVYTSCTPHKTVEADIKASVGVVLFDPHLQTADVTDVQVVYGPAPYLIFGFTDAGAMAAATNTIKLIQKSRY